MIPGLEDSIPKMSVGQICVSRCRRPRVAEACPSCRRRRRRRAEWSCFWAEDDAGTSGLFKCVCCQSAVLLGLVGAAKRRFKVGVARGASGPRDTSKSHSTPPSICVPDLSARPPRQGVELRQAVRTHARALTQSGSSAKGTLRPDLSGSLSRGSLSTHAYAAAATMSRPPSQEASLASAPPSEPSEPEEESGEGLFALRGRQSL